jgi:DMSO/TMAO reductase YedYZ molybdopterin-dependent catalytic subunit
VAEAFDVRPTELATLPRRELTADFHCVAGWSATNLRREGVSFDAVFRAFIEPALPPGTSVTHLVFQGLDGWRSVVSVEDALADNVLLAQHLNGRRLDSDHGAPARLVSPAQYGYVNTKHLSRIKVLTSEPCDPYGSSITNLALRLLGRHPRARVWQEEPHRYLPPWSVRHLYRASIAPIAYLSARGGCEARNASQLTRDSP